MESTTDSNSHIQEIDTLLQEVDALLAEMLKKGRAMPQRSSKTQTQRKIAAILRHPLTWLALVIALASLTFLTVSNLSAKGAPSDSGSVANPADLFMQSVVKRDGNLGWHQLCPSLQAQITLAALTSQVQQQQASEANQHLSFTLDYVGAHQNPQGGQFRIYVVVAHRPGGWFAQRTYVITTQESGCVADISTS